VAACGFERVLDVEHLVEKDVLDDEGGDGGAVQAAIQNNLIKRGIEAAELGVPISPAPSQARAAQASRKVAAIEAREDGGQIVGPARGTAGDAASARAAQPINATARGGRQREAAVFLQGFARGAAAQDAREKDDGSGLDDAGGRSAQGVGEADVGGVVTQANGMGEARVGIKLDDELRRAPVAAEARVEPVEELGAAGDGTGFGA